VDGNALVTGIGLLWLFGLVLLVVWIILPFAIIGTKPLLRQLIEEQRRTNELLARRLARRDSTPDNAS
jgi:hypothetical protein